MDVVLVSGLFTPEFALETARATTALPTRFHQEPTFDGSGKLKSQATKVGELLPHNPGGLANASGPNPKGLPPSAFYLAGDVRANEHAVLTSMHTLFVREHNRLCDQIKNQFPAKYQSDEAIYQAARKVVGAQMQVITYKEFLPALLGRDAMGEWKGYDPLLEPTIANEFSTAFYRLGHTMLSDSILLGKSYQHSTLKQLFFDPSLVSTNGIEEYLGGLHLQSMQKVDSHVVNSVRNFLFNPPGFNDQHMFLDLVCLNIMRGRDHGLPGYNACRTAYGLPTRSSFDLISRDPSVVSSLSSVYTSPDDIDPWLGALIEDNLPGAAVGELTRAALVEQFTRLRDGDRFWWENDNAPILNALRYEIETVTLGKVLSRNTIGINFPDDVFHR